MVMFVGAEEKKETSKKCFCMPYMLSCFSSDPFSP